MSRFSTAAALFLLATALPGLSAAQVAPPPDLLGAYAPGGDCAKEPRVTVSATAMTIQAGGKATRLAPIDACFSCAGGDRYEGIEVWVAQLGPDQSPKEPMFRLNADEKKGALVVDKQGMQAFPPAVRAVAMASPLKRCAKP